MKNPKGITIVPSYQNQNVAEIFLSKGQTSARKYQQSLRNETQTWQVLTVWKGSQIINLNNMCQQSPVKKLPTCSSKLQSTLVKSVRTPKGKNIEHDLKNNFVRSWLNYQHNQVKQQLTFS
ncbi:hypothetical protein LOTGIDRAFT_173624 [Lottia gigantea]|uniref:Uncharacterized protein n=1 Tax=Lottia gigantea TaxID=225164 RepID=V4AX96_LOTGI|nr:hypothetical protein LOTGIDRAFT_173624 [Lottia gigantea]ESO99680.1 hypothetical protein LOTGIDRAFT_173624 [Lottia gigantea]